MAETETLDIPQPSAEEEAMNRDDHEPILDAQNTRDASRSESESESDSDSEDESLTKAQIEALEAEISSNPSSYDAHVQYIKIIRKQGDIEKLRQAREAMSVLFPLNPEMWREWAKDETTISSGMEAVPAVEKLYERGVSDYLVCRKFSRKRIYLSRNLSVKCRFKLLSSFRSFKSSTTRFNVP